MRIPQWLVWVWVLIMGIAAVGGSVFAYAFVRDRATELDTVLNLPDPPQIGRPGADSAPAPTQTLLPSATPEPTIAPDSAALGDTPVSTPPETGPSATPDPVPAPWQDPRRVSVLLLGIDQRSGEQGTFPTDTMILFSLDPVGKTAAILSIPRDLWVEYPSVGRTGRINGANILGDSINYPGGGGAAFAVKTVEKVLGVTIPYYVLINFEVFYNLVDALGPVEVCPTEVIHDDAYPDGSYGYMTVHFDPGCQALDSERLLQYARTRHGDTQGDIGRSTRQQEVILKVREKALSLGGVTSLLPKAVALWESMQDNIRTNLSFEDLVSLARRAEQIDSANIRQGQISFDEVYFGTSPEGETVLVPIGTDIRLLIEDLFRPANAPSAQQ